MFWGLLYAQAAGTLAAALLAGGLLLEAGALPAALGGGGISLLGYAWAGYQLWWRPGNGSPEQILGRTVYAQVGKVTIFLVLFALAFHYESRLHRPDMLGALVAGFIGAQLAGWLHLARRGDGEGTGNGAGNRNR